LIALNKILQPIFEVRLWLDSVGSDTLAFIPLSSAEWNSLENEFGAESVRYHFMLITEDSKMFDMESDTVSAIIKERGL